MGHQKENPTLFTIFWPSSIVTKSRIQLRVENVTWTQAEAVHLISCLCVFYAQEYSQVITVQLEFVSALPYNNFALNQAI